MKILIIGGAGYLGVPLSNSMNDCDVTVYDKFLYSNITFLNKSVTIIHDDVSNIEKYGELLNSQDVIVYLASPRLLELTDSSQLKKLDLSFQVVVVFMVNELMLLMKNLILKYHLYILN